jgi:hypothetical protein
MKIDINYDSEIITGEFETLPRIGDFITIHNNYSPITRKVIEITFIGNEENIFTPNIQLADQ